MRSELDVLVDKVSDGTLRADIRTQLERVQAKRTFGLVFESHLPERVRLPEHSLRVGVRVALRDQVNGEGYEVLALSDTTATVKKVQHADGSSLSDEEAAETNPQDFSQESLVVVADFGEPVFPGLRHLKSIRRGGDRAAQVVIKGENHHVLEALQFTHAGRVDCIYIDPPYNTGARDWKYDNDYVDENDAYRHSKWLAFMERRLLLAKELLNPEHSVLIVTIDEKEYLRLGLLLEQVFVGCNIQMVTTVVNPQGTGRTNEFSRTNEFIFFVMVGAVTIYPGPDNMYDRNEADNPIPVEWRNLRRRERTSKRGSRPNQFYPVFVDEETGHIHSVGEPLADDVPRSTVKAPVGTRVCFPLTPDGTEMIWGVVPESLRSLVAKGYARSNGSAIQFLNAGTVKSIESGSVIVKGRDDHGAVIAEFAEGAKKLMPKSVWVRESHNAQASGTLMLSKLIPGRDFPFPKSLYAVEDAIRFFVRDKPDAVVLDFFGGSGTTTHAVARLNRQDNGQRQSIVITNNEVSAADADSLRAQGLQPGDAAWEALGIFEHIAMPRVTSAITGSTPEGSPIEGEYKFIDEFPMADGFSENVEFFELTYLDPDDIEIDAAFNSVAPLLWLRAGGRGRVIQDCIAPDGCRSPYTYTDTYGVLFNPDRWRAFSKDLPRTATAAFIVTDSQATFAGIAAELPMAIDAVRLYERYLTTFAINRGYS